MELEYVGSSTKRRRTWEKGLFRFSSQTATCYYQSNHSKVERISLSALPKDTKSELSGLSSHYPSFMLNVKQGSCEYQLLSLLVWLGQEIEPRSTDLQHKNN